MWETLERLEARAEIKALAGKVGTVFIPRGSQCMTEDGAARSEQLLLSIIAVAHQGPSGHRMAATTCDAVESLFSFSDMRRDVAAQVQNCLQCIKNAAGTSVPRPLGATVLGEKPGEVVHMDFFFMGPAEPPNGDYQLTIADGLTGYVKLSVHDDCTAYQASSALLEWIALFDVPRLLISDGGPHFVNRVLKRMAFLLGYTHHVTTAHIHHAAGTVEILQRAHKALYRKLCSELKIAPENASCLTPVVQYAQNATKSPTYGVVPMTAMTGITPTSPLKAVVTVGHDIRSSKVVEISEAVLEICKPQMDATRDAIDGLHKDLVSKKTEARAKQRAKRRGRRGVKPHMPQVDVGDFVLVAFPDAGLHKLRFVWHGPYVVAGPHLSDVIVRSSPADGINECSHVYVVHPMGQPENTSKVHVERLKRFAAKDVDMPVDILDRAQGDLGSYIVESIDGHRIKDGSVELKIKWLGFTDEDSTFEPLDDKLAEVPVLVREYVRLHKDEHALLRKAFDDIDADREADKLARKARRMEARREADADKAAEKRAKEVRRRRRRKKRK